MKKKKVNIMLNYISICKYFLCIKKSKLKLDFIFQILFNKLSIVSICFNLLIRP